MACLEREWNWFEQSAVGSCHLERSKWEGQCVCNCQCDFGVADYDLYQYPTTSPVSCSHLTDDCAGTLEDLWTSGSQIGSFGSNQAHDVFPVGEKTICYVQRIWHRSSYCHGANAGRCRSFVS